MAEIASRSSSSDIITSILVIPLSRSLTLGAVASWAAFYRQQDRGVYRVYCVLLWAGLGYESVIQETYCHAAAGTSSQGGVATYNRSQHGAPIILPHITPYCPKLTAAQYPAQPITCSSSGNVGKQIKLSCSSSSLQPGADCCRPSCSATAADTTAVLQTLSYQWRWLVLPHCLLSSCNHLISCVNHPSSQMSHVYVV